MMGGDDFNAARRVTLDAVQAITFPSRSAEDRVLVPMEVGREVPFVIARIFTIRAERAGLTGGRHAHRRCAQLILCVDGRCDVACRTDDGVERVWRLDRPELGVLVPPGIWAEQRYLDDRTGLLVLCDRAYEEADYIRDFEAYRKFRASGE